MIRKLVGLLFLLGSTHLAIAGNMTGMPGMIDGNRGASTVEFEGAMQKMMESMHSKPYTGDTDFDFVTHMIPHHQGAIDSAKIELKYGIDPELRSLAKSIIDSQQKEIAFQEEWLRRHSRGLPQVQE